MRIILLPQIVQEKPDIPLKHRHSHSFINRWLRVWYLCSPGVCWKILGKLLAEPDSCGSWHLWSLFNFRALGWVGELCQFQVDDVVDVSHLRLYPGGRKISKLSTYQKLNPVFWTPKVDIARILKKSDFPLENGVILDDPADPYRFIHPSTGGSPRGFWSRDQQICWLLRLEGFESGWRCDAPRLAFWKVKNLRSTQVHNGTYIYIYECNTPHQEWSNIFVLS